MEVYAERSNRHLVMMFDQPVVSQSRPWMGGSPDAIEVETRTVADSKNVGHRGAEDFGEPGTDQMPDYYRAQLEWLMEVLDFDHADLPVLVAGQDYRLFRASRHRPLAAALIEIGEKFWTEHVVKDIPPEVTDSEASRAYIRSRFPRDLVPLRDATEEEAISAEQLARIREACDRLEKTKADLEARFKLAIGDAAGIQGEGFRITWKASKDSAKTDWESIARGLKTRATAEEWETLTGLHTRRIDGVRRFVPKFDETLLLGKGNDE